MAKATGVSEGTYSKLDKMMKSDNEELKGRLRQKKTSIDKAYKEFEHSNPATRNMVTPENQINKIDNRLNAINKKISDLESEKDTLICKRRLLFEGLDIPCELKYEFVENYYRDCKFFIEVNGHREIFVQCMVIDESPAYVYLTKIPDKYKNDFIMLWTKAHQEDIEYSKLKKMESEKQYEELLLKDNAKKKNFYRQCYRILAKSIHPDNSKGDLDAMQCLNQLKDMWGV
jgi:hypothetical protein